MGCLKEEIEGYGTADEKIKLFDYNSYGQIVSKTVPGFSNSIKFTYNPLGYLETVKFNDENHSNNQDISNVYYYTMKGKVAKAINKLSETIVERTYNYFDQMISEEFWVGRNRYSVKYTYDRKGRIKTIQLPDNSSIAYVYDAVFCREVKRLSPKKEVLYVHTYDNYDTSGKLLSETLIGQTGVRNYQYDLNSNMTQIDLPNINISEQAEYDHSGKIISLDRKVVDRSSKVGFAYNDLSQLTSENNEWANFFGYDSLNNRLSLNGNELTYNALNQLQSNSQAEYLYDQQGNLCRKTANQKTTGYESNVLSEVIQIENADQTKVRFIYDPLGRRLAKEHVSPDGKSVLSRECFLYLNDQEIGTLGERGKILKLRIPGMKGSDISLKSVSLELNQKVYATVHNIQQHLIALIDSSTSCIAESYSYSAFGQEKIYDCNGIALSESAVGNPWRFSEKRVDQETGLVFFGRRYYDPEVGRWISPDPIGKFDGPNAYAYLHNNPINRQDRFGLAIEDFLNLLDEIYFHGEWEYFVKCGGVYPDQACIVIIRQVNDSGNAQRLPAISYNDNFENMLTHYNSAQDFWTKEALYDNFRPYYERSRTYDLNLPDSKDQGIGFINGINNTFEDSVASASYISRLAKGFNVHAVYNATHGVPSDLQECKMGLDYIATEPVRQLHKMWNNYFDQSSDDAMFLMFCHSQGAIHTRNALLDYPEHLRNRIMVVAIAPAAYIYQESCARVIHYRVPNDIVPRFDHKGAMRSRETIVDLKSHPSAPLFDHSFNSPTYLDKIQWHIDEYFKTNGRNI